MKSTELQMLWKLVKDGEERPLSAADLAFDKNALRKIHTSVSF
jgi:hypothetical protein